MLLMYMGPAILPGFEACYLSHPFIITSGGNVRNSGAFHFTGWLCRMWQVCDYVRPCLPVCMYGLVALHLFWVDGEQLCAMSVPQASGVQCSTA